MTAPSMPDTRLDVLGPKRMAIGAIYTHGSASFHPSSRTKTAERVILQPQT
jgi:hypothetical protein